MSRLFQSLSRRNLAPKKTNTLRRSRLALLPLEERTVPTVILVTNTNDAGPGSLRQALVDAASPARPGMDVINFNASVVGTITLATPLSVNTDVTIQGPGANVLAISGNKSVRVFDVSDGASSAVTAIVIGLTVKDGAATSGAGISVGQNDVLQLDSCWLTGNTASAHGGGIDVANSGDLTVLSSTLSGNNANLGGAVYFNGTATGGSIDFRNSTISGNSAASGGGIALANFSGDAAISNSTVVYNAATGGTGGGINRVSGMGSVSLVSSIVWGNTTLTATGADVATSGTVNYSRTILGNSSGIGLLVNQGNNLAIGTNPTIGNLLNNGGTVPMHALLAGSPAIDKGVNSATACMTDERGAGYTRSYGTTDIGAYEYSLAGIPTVAGTFADVTSTGGSSYTFQLTYRDDGFINAANIGTGQDIFITGPNGFFAWATNTAIDINSNGTPRVATYTVTPPGGAWDGFDNGTYTIAITKNAVYDNAANPVPAGDIGQFRVAAAANRFLVTNSADNGPGSLRAAVDMANVSIGTPDTVAFDPMFFNVARSIVLTSGEIAVTDPVTIQGLGASLITVDGNGTDRIFDINDGKAGGMVVTIDGLTLANGITSGPGGAILINDEVVTLTNSVLTGNRSTGSGLAPGGGAVAVTGAGSITVSDCVLTNNKATGPGGDGGAIRAADGSAVSLNRTLISGNVANGDGGGVYQSGTNTASTLSVTASAIVGNSATDLLGTGGGLCFTGTASNAVIRNSTISGNMAVAFGGGIGLNGLIGNLAVQNCTITDNSAGSSSKGGGVSQTGGSGQVQFESTVISGNINPSAPDVYTTGKATFRTSALGSKAGIATFIDNGNNLPIGVALNLGALTNNGGPTPTHLPAANSLLVDRGSNPAGLAVDQRGSGRLDGVSVDIGAVEIVSPGLPVASAGPFADVTTTGGTTYNIVVTYADNGAINATTIDNSDVRVIGPNGYNVLATLIGVDTPGNGSPRIATYQITAPGGNWDGSDAGIYSVSLEPNQVQDTSANSALAVTFGSFRADLSTTYVVTNANDSGAGSLRNAIALANITSAPDTITFDPSFFAVSRTIGLTTGELLVTGPVRIQGTSSAKLAVSGSNLSRVFDINDGSALTSAIVSISNITISGGKSGAEGGGIYLFDEQLSLSGVVVTNNFSTTGAGGGIFVASKNAVLNITDSTISQNTSGLGMSGGGIRIDGAATLNIARTTISGNVAQLRGGGIYFNNGGSLLVSDSTISGNIAQTKDGGGVYFFGQIGAGGLVFRNSTISGNSAAGQGGGVAFVSASGTPVFQNCTVTANTANGGAGGIARVSGPNTISLVSTIIAANISPSVAPDLSFDAPVAVASDRSLIGVADFGNFTLTGTGNLTGTSATPLDPLLAPLATNFGGTKTHALKAGSPALNTGSNSAGLTFDQRGSGFVRSSGPATDIGAYETQYAPTITGIIINDGSIQRSRVASITVPFVTMMNFAGNPVNAFKLEKMVAGAPVGTVTLAVDLSASTASQTIAKLTFSGPLTEFTSLVDGQYRLTVLAANVTDFSGQTLDGNGDTVMGDNFVTAPGAIFRLFGDIDGDAMVAVDDFLQFRTRFAQGPDFAFDFDNDGMVSVSDFDRFRQRFNSSI
jgi:Right handed beta helix region